MQPTRAILFDVYATLIDLTTDEEDPAVYAFLSDWLSYKGLKIEPAEFRRLYQQLAAREFVSNAHNYPDIDIANVFTGILNTINPNTRYTVEDTAVNELATLFRIMTTMEIELIRETSSALEALSERVTLGIVSNTQRLFTLPELKKFQLTQYFDQLVFSSDVLASKPNPRIFRHALAGLDVLPEEVIFIGDNLFDDIWGAQQVGICTVWFDRGRPVKMPDGIEQPEPDAQFHQGSSGSLYDLLSKML
jgi:putative hydrolase of the HAD superfamily